MASGNITPGIVFPHLNRCGYGGDRLRRDYVYFVNSDKRKIAGVGFARGFCDSYNACIGIIDGCGIKDTEVGAAVQEHCGLGAPVILVCRGESLLFWHFRERQGVEKERIKFRELDEFFDRYQDDFKPERILRAKKMGRVNKDYQLEFVDLGLMPFIEEQEGKYLAGLVERIIGELAGEKTLESWHFQAAFWLIGAKILQDKGVEGFKRLDIENIDLLMEKIRRHYNAQKEPIIPRSRIKQITKVAREMLKPVSSFSHMTIDSLSYVYENTLVTQATRKALGIHATPSWLVNYIVWQLADWIEEIPEEKRFILEPACGHAPFLTAGARLLSFLYKGKEENRHDYLKNHLRGIEKDSFAGEIARLSLTLADLPNKDGWEIKNDDIYNRDVLKQAAERATILFCNPPFENFKKKETEHYQNVETGNKAAEVLARSLPYMPDNSVFGIILPQGFLHKKKLGDLRKYILDNYEIRTICNLPEIVFAKARHLSTVLLCRKKISKKNILYVRVHKSRIEEFKNRYQAKEWSRVKQDYYRADNYSFRIPELNEIWEYCSDKFTLDNICDIGKGLEFEGKDLPKGSITISDKLHNNLTEGFASYDKKISITELPPVVYLNLSSEVVRRPQWGTECGKSQVLFNYTRVGSGPWRLKAWIDNKGHSFTSNFLVARPKDFNICTINFTWALLNSPFANAFAYCHNMERSNSAGVMRTMPVPFGFQDLSGLEEMVREYFVLSEKQKDFMAGEEAELKEKKKRCLLRIDAEILRLYDLPPRLEKQLLDFFAGYQRKGVDFAFDRYYPEGFGSDIPLRMFISEEFENATMEKVEKWVEDNRSPEVVKALDKAAKAFERD